MKDPERARARKNGESDGEFQWHPKDFERRPMVPWFNPGQLAATGVRALMASIFGSYADKRDVMAVAAEAGVCDDLAGEATVWLDYVADVGDGWASTYTMAYLLGQSSLPTGKVALPEALEDTTLPRGDILVFGGDEVYPTATRDEYHHRFVGPYTASLPYLEKSRWRASKGAGKVPPLLFAIPGNHDWYDGLTSFTRLFCQSRWVGGRKTRQSRSYFAIQLPYNWWLWGVDTQLHSDIDRPQIDFFQSIAKGTLPTLSGSGTIDGHKIILCVPSPEWIATDGLTKKEREKAQRFLGPYSNLDYFEERVIKKHGAQLAVTLTGDVHHYAHYVETGDSPERERRPRQHKITAGGGGAYTRAAHRLPEALMLGKAKRTYKLVDSFPNKPDSRKLVRKATLAFVTKRPNLWFSGFIASLYLWFAWLVQSTSKMLGGVRGSSFMEDVHSLGLGDWPQVAMEAWEVTRHGPGVALTGVFVVAMLTVFSRASSKKFHLVHVVGAVHGFIHIVVALLAMWAFARINLNLLQLGVDDPEQTLLFLAEMFVLGGLAGGLVMGAYLVLGNGIFKLNDNEVLSCQSDPDYGSFVRMRLDATGLTLYPLGVRRTLRKEEWEPTFEDPEGNETELTRFLRRVRRLLRIPEPDSAPETPARDKSDPWWEPKKTIRIELLSPPPDAHPPGIVIPNGVADASTGPEPSDGDPRHA